MDECDAQQRAQKHTAVETARPPLVPAEKNNALNRRIRTREVSSRYKSTLTSPSFSSSSGPRRCPSPNITRTVPSPSPLAQKRAQSAERKRPSTPPSTPPTPSTPTRDSSMEAQFSSSRLISGRTLDGLWPSTMRSLSVSFQSDTFSLPITKREKPVTHTPVDRTLRPPSNVAVQRKPTPERKQSPFRGKNGSDQSENSKPIDQHRWPSRTGGKRTLYDVWNTTLELWESITMKKIDLQKLRLELKLNLVLNEQMAYLEDWALLERDHSNSLSGAIEDLQASTLRLPVTGGARADIETIKIAVCSAINVMQALGSSLHSLLSRMEGLNCLVAELAELAAQEKAMLDDCEALLASTATTQVEEYSLRTHLIQLKQVMKMAQQPIFGMTTLP